MRLTDLREIVSCAAHTRVDKAPAYSLALTLAACIGQGDHDYTWALPKSSPEARAEAASMAAPGDRLLYRTGAEWTTRTDPVSGETVTELEDRYYLLGLWANGQAYLGVERDDIDDGDCTGSAEDTKGRPRCAAYELRGGTLRIEGKDHTFADQGGTVTIDEKPWRVLSPYRIPVGRYDLAGVFGATGSDATLQGASLELTEDGTFVAIRHAQSYPMFAVDLWAGCADDCTIRGTFTARRHSIVLQSEQGAARRFFLRVDENDVQIGDQWFRRSADPHGVATPDHRGSGHQLLKDTGFGKWPDASGHRLLAPAVGRKIDDSIRVDLRLGSGCVEPCVRLQWGERFR